MQSEEKQPKLLQSLGHKVFNLAHYATNIVVQLPKPVAYVGESVMQPIVQVAENQSLQVLKFLDNQLYMVGEVIENCLQSAVSVANIPKDVTTKLSERGLVGSAGDMWVKYQDPVKKKTEPVVRVLLKIPGFSLVYPVFSGVGNMVSDWLVEHSEVEEKDVHALEEYKGDKLVDALIDEQDEHKYVEDKVDEGMSEEDVGHEYVKEKVSEEENEKVIKEVNKEKAKKKTDEDDTDELTKLIDAGWGLGSV